MKIAAVSVDLDEIHHYFSVHGLPLPTGGLHAVYDVALDRLRDLARAHGAPLTLFAVGADMARAGNAARLRAFAGEGHEIGNHSLEHLYDLTRRPAAEIRRQVGGGREVLAGATGQRPGGFRSPGYTMTDELLSAIAASGHDYDSSVFPCPAYYLAKAAALGVYRLRGRASRSVLDDPRVLAAPRRPYRAGASYRERGAGLLEIPIQVTPRTRLPFIGTALTLSPDPVGAALTRAVSGEPTINIELHGVDLLDRSDGLEALAASQPDLRVPWAEKRRRIDASLGMLREAGYGFTTLGELSRRVGRG